MTYRLGEEFQRGCVSTKEHKPENQRPKCTGTGKNPEKPVAPEGPRKGAWQVLEAPNGHSLFRRAGLQGQRMQHAAHVALQGVIDHLVLLDP